MTRISRKAYAEMFGPTVGDRVRLADTNLLVEVEKDFTVYGEEVKFGGVRSFVTVWARASDAAQMWLTRSLPMRSSSTIGALSKPTLALKTDELLELEKRVIPISNQQ